MKKIELEFKGYWIEKRKKGLPDKSGIYCVYSCIYNEEKNSVSIHNLLYIGESVNVRERIANHNKLDEWKRMLKDNETLCYSFASVTNPDRERAEAALIYEHMPPTNDEYVENFTYEDTKIVLYGDIRKLSKNFTAYSD